MKQAMVKQPSYSILMLENRAVQTELPPTHPNYGTSVNRAKADWKRFAARHSKGGHLLFADGHAARFTNAAITTSTNANDFNYPNVAAKVIWNPVGPTGN